MCGKIGFALWFARMKREVWMQEKSVEQLYEKHIKHLSQQEQLRLLSLMAQRLVVAPTVGKRRSLTALYGLGKEMWKDTDAQAYVRGLRDEWEER
jgi:hypothetical protein